MPGKTKRKYQGELMRNNKKLKRPLMFVQKVLPKDYDINIILEEFKKYYPYEWKELNERYHLSDNDFLKRDFVSDYTKMVLKKRLEQSKNLLLVLSKDSIASKWVEYELDSFSELDKPIYYICLDDIEYKRKENYKELQYDFSKSYIQKLE